jgi:outer membrane protein assembly factor BamD
MRNLLSSNSRRGHLIARLVALALLAPVLAGCDTLAGWWGMREEQFEEPADKLYNEGLYLLNSKKDLRTAAKRFEEVDRQHPYSDWARRALIMSAYTYYQAGMYEESITASRRYIQLHPGSPDAAYAQFLIGSCYFDQIRDVTRDQDRTERAMAAFDEVIRKYPSSEYAVSAKRRVDVGRDQLAARDMMIGRYYMERRDYTGAINRFKVVVTRYQTTRHVEEALLRLTEAYLSLGIVGEAQTSAAVLGHNFPESRWYKDAYALVQQRGLQPSENRDSWISQAFRKLGIGGTTGQGGQ